VRKLNELPKLTVRAAHGDLLQCSYEPSKCIGNNWIGVLIYSSERFIWGRFQSVNPDTSLCDFFVDDEREASIATVGECHVAH